MHLKVIAQKHAKAKKYIKGRNSSLGEMSQPTWKNKSKKKGVGQIGVATEKDTCKAEPKTTVGRFRQYTPLVTIAEHMLNQIFGRGLLREPS